jgi:hypothetical protein
VAETYSKTTLTLDGDATPWFTPEVDGFTLLRVTMAPHASFAGEVLFETRVSYPAGSASTVKQVDVAAVTSLVPATEYIVAVPRGFDFRVSVAEAVITLANNVVVMITAYKAPNFGSLGPKVVLGPSLLDTAEGVAVVAAPVAAQITAIEGVITDLEADVAGNSVAQAITDLGAVVTALGG